MEKILNSSGIYKIVCAKNNKIYIGSALNLNKRKREHFSCLKNNTHFNHYLQNCFNKYGEEAFIFEVVLYCEQNELLIKEEEQIKVHNSYKNGFNMLEKPTKNMFGYKHTQEAKKQMSFAAKARGRPKHSSIFSTEQVKEIRQHFFNGVRIGELSLKYMVHHSTIKKCVYLQSYADVECDIEGYVEMLNEIKEQRDIGKRPRSSGWKHSKEFIDKFRSSVIGPKLTIRKLTEDQILNIRKEKQQGLTCRELAQKYSVNQNTISRICRRLIYAEI